MTSLELVLTALEGRPTPRVPTGPLAVHFCAGLAGQTLRAYSTNAQVLAECVLRYYERFRPDALWISADTWVSAEALGARVGATDDHQPLGGLGPPLVREVGDLDRLPGPDVHHQGRHPILIEALARVKRAVGDDACVVGCFDQYPFSLAAALMGIDPCMVRLRDDLPFLQALMRHGEAHAVAYGRALAEAGADLLSGGDSPAGLIGPNLYQSVALPAEQRVIAGLKAATGKPVSLHICGRTTRLLPLMAQTGADILEVDHGVDIATACRTVGPGIALWGNLDPVGVLAQGTPESVRRQTRSVLGAVRTAGHARFVLSSGCTLAMETPNENLEAMLDEARL